MEHKMICTVDKLGETMERLSQHNGKAVRAKQIDSVRYLITWETEDDNKTKGKEE